MLTNESLNDLFNFKKGSSKWLNVEKKQRKRKRLKKEEEDNYSFLIKVPFLKFFRKGTFFLFNYFFGMFSGISSGISLGTSSVMSSATLSLFKALSIFCCALSPTTTSNSDFSLS